MQRDAFTVATALAEHPARRRRDIHAGESRRERPRTVAYPQQFHLDVAVDDVDPAEAVVLKLGATSLSSGG